MRIHYRSICIYIVTVCGGRAEVYATGKMCRFAGPANANHIWSNVQQIGIDALLGNYCKCISMQSTVTV